MRDIFFHTQWCAALAMVAVQWPRFVCKFPQPSGSSSTHVPVQTRFWRKPHGQH